MTTVRFEEAKEQEDTFDMANGWVLNRGIKPVVDGTMIDVVYMDSEVEYGVISGLPAKYQAGDKRVALYWEFNHTIGFSILLWRLSK